MTLEVGDQHIDKEFAVGDGFMRVSQRRPARMRSDVLLHPRDSPLPAGTPVQAVEIAYPAREAWTCGTGSWLVYWFVVSLVAAFAAQPILKVNK